jgi:methylmalonyl-CoA mutase cobalamin-binding subunit
LSSTGTIFALLTRLSEAGPDAVLWGRAALPHFGPVFDRLLRKRVLVERPCAGMWPTCADCDCGMDARLIVEVDGTLVAACPHDHHADQTLAPDDLRSFRIDAERFVIAMAEASGFDNAAAILPGLWHMGRLASGRVVFLALQEDAVAQPGVVLALRAAASGAPIMLIAPEIPPAVQLRFSEAGINVAVLRSVLTASSSGIDVINVAALEAPAHTPRLVIAKSAQTVALDDRQLHFPSQLQRLVVMLAEQALSKDPILSHQVIGGATGRESRDIIRDLRANLVAQGLGKAEANALIMTVSPRGYRLGLAPAEISLRS